MRKTEHELRSKDGIHKLHVVLWEPEGNVRGVLQISHGMIEMIDRYDDFARYLNENGGVDVSSIQLNRCGFGLLLPQEHECDRRRGSASRYGLCQEAL